MEENKKTFINFKFEQDLFDTLNNKIQDVTFKDCLNLVIEPTKIASDVIKEISNIKLSDCIDGIENIQKYFSNKPETIKEEINKKTISNKLFNTPNVDFVSDYYVPLLTLFERNQTKSIQECLKDFANSKPKTNKIYHRIAFVCGTPGAGKSVEGRIFTLRQAEAQKEKKFEKFNPLKWFGEQDCDDEAPKLCVFIPLGSEYYNNQQETNKKTFLIPPATGIIYLDGLDEVHYQSNNNYDGSLKEGNVAIRILSAVGTLLSNNPNLKVIIGLRKTLFDELKNINRDDNFNTLVKDCENVFDILPLKGNNHDTRLEFAKKILKYDTINLQKFTEQIQYNALDDITSEPILLSFYLQSLKVKNDMNVDNKSELYYAVFQNFFNREAPENCSKNTKLTKDSLEQNLPVSQPNPFINAICGKAKNDFNDAFDIFHHILEMIALTAWQEKSDRMASRGRVIQSIKEYDEIHTTEFAQYFEQSNNSGEQAFGVIAFYFGIQENGNLEFLHKSFVEYFVACGYLRLIIEAVNCTKSAEKFKDITVANAYNSIISEFVSDAVSLPFVKNLIANKKIQSFKSFEELLGHYMYGKYPYHNKDGNFSDITTLNAHLVARRNIIFTIFMLYSFLFQKNFKNQEKQYWNLNFSKRYLSLLLSDTYHNHIYANTIDIFLQNANLNEYNLSGCDLALVQLQNANLENANLQRVKLHENEHLNGANLKRVSFCYADLSYANLSNTNLEDADLKGVRFQGIKLGNAKYNSSTNFPKSLKSKTYNMIYVSKISDT